MVREGNDLPFACFASSFIWAVTMLRDIGLLAIFFVMFFVGANNFIPWFVRRIRFRGLLDIGRVK